MTTSSSKIDRMKSADERMRELNNKIVVDYSPSVGINSYFRVCRSMLNMADEYESDGCKIEAYCLRRRHRQDYKTCNSRIQHQWSQECDRVLKRVEEMHNEILATYNAEAFELQKILRAPSPPTDLPTPLSPNTNVIPSPLISNSTSAKLSPPMVDRSTKPTTVSPATSLIDGLHPILVPNTLVSTFLRLAEPNTLRKLETCGTLCGRLSPEGDKLLISHLIISKQIVTPNSCTTTNEEELLECIESSGLIVLGWIHTHPSQTAFMSSMDLHCHLSYQLMLPEAIAIVCSPTFNKVEYFSLTPDYGLGFILECRQTGFHEHSATRDLYTRCKHVVFTNAPIEVRDLR
nr:STAM binding protein [Hymenolepis microstoma]